MEHQLRGATWEKEAHARSRSYRNGMVRLWASELTEDGEHDLLELTSLPLRVFYTSFLRTSR